MLCDSNVQIGGKKPLKITTFERGNVSTQSDASKFTHHIRVVSLSWPICLAAD